MKRFEIEKEFTSMVAAYLAEGWVINTKSMGGSQGEEGKVDLVKGEELIRIWMSKEMSRNWLDKGAWSGYIMHLRVGRWNRPASDSFKHGCTVWMKDLDNFCDKMFYEIESSDGGWYVEDLEEAMEFQRKHYDRYSKHYQPYEEILSGDKAKEIATKFLKRTCGYKRISWDKIVVRKNLSTDLNHAAYYVIYNGNSYRVY